MSQSYNSQEDIQQRVKEQAKQRFDKSMALCQKGLLLFNQSREDNYQDRKLLRQACHCFMDAIQLSRTNVKSYLYLAQTFLTFNQKDQALKYLREAKKLAPNHPDIALMMDFLSQVQSKQKDVDASLDIPETQENIEELYDKVEQYLYQKIKVIMTAKQVPKQPAIEAEKIAQLQHHHQELEEVCRSINIQLDIIAQELCVSELRIKLHPLQQLKKQFAQQIQVSNTLIEIYSAIQELTKTTLNQIKTLQARHAGTTVNIETILDQCDQIADDLDELSQTNPQNITALEPSYKQLITVIERLQDEMDNAQEEELLF